jgi:uncharacterized protein (TIGR03083 family)
MGSTFTRTELANGLVAEYAAFADLIEGLDEGAWRKATRCEGAEVRDIAGHVTGLAEDVTIGAPGSRLFAEEAASLRELPPREVAQHLRDANVPIGDLVTSLDEEAWNGPSPVDGLTLGRGVLTLLYDTYVHNDDIRAALGMPSARGLGLRASVEYLAGELTTRGWGPAQLHLDGMAPVSVNGDGGPTVTGDALAFVLAATGRTDPSLLGLDASVNIYAE